MSEHVWTRVSKHHPCPICSRTDWCGFTAGAVCCMRVESNRTLKNGGWLHILDATVGQRPPPLARVPKPRPTLDWYAMHRTFLGQTTGRMMQEQAESLGVGVTCLARLGWSWTGEAFAIPMRTPDGEICGFRLRAVDGRKWAITGSHQGLFIADGAFPDLATTLCLVEGPTDCAAMLSLGFHDAMGRPSCSGGHDLVFPLAAGRDVVIIADRDEPKLRPDGTTWFPGAEGAERLAAALLPVVRSLRMMKPVDAKDVRAWVQAGATAKTIRTAMQNARPWTPAPKPKKVIERF